MSILVCNTSPLQYLYQLELLHILPALAERVIVPPAVVDELSVGRNWGVSLTNPAEYDWVEVRRPVSEQALPLVTDLGPGNHPSSHCSTACKCCDFAWTLLRIKRCLS